ncbi:hypothetical protein NQZ68_023233 [Dissostichus eleginoides]|nr:hypothetical protein NQZ68_023233 [Dissostichus eleginoides]
MAFIQPFRPFWEESSLPLLQSPPPSPTSSSPPPPHPKYCLCTIRLGSRSQTSDRKHHRGSSRSLILDEREDEQIEQWGGGGRYAGNAGVCRALVSPEGNAASSSPHSFLFTDRRKAAAFARHIKRYDFADLRSNQEPENIKQLFCGESAASGAPAAPPGRSDRSSALNEPLCFHPAPPPPPNNTTMTILQFTKQLAALSVSLPLQRI